jgi:uncharacterized protein (TIGR03435 family)
MNFPRPFLLLVFSLVLCGLTLSGSSLSPSQSTPAAPQTPSLAFEVASIKPSALDPAKLVAAVRAGQMPHIGPHVDPQQAQYIYMTLRDLIVIAYGVKSYQITGPDWIAGPRFDIIAKLPDGASKDDAPHMLQSLLEERFKLSVHRETKQHQVLALTVAKGGPKLKPSDVVPQPIDDSAQLKPGEMSVDSAEGPVRVAVASGATTVNMGARGVVVYKVDPATSTMHLDASGVTMSGFADMLSQFSQLVGGGSGPQVVDGTDLAGNYDLALDFSPADMLNMARAAGTLAQPPAGNPAGVASDPAGTASLFEAVRNLGLVLQPRNESVEQLVVDHVEKNPIEN